MAGLDLPQRRKIDIDDVLIAGQHQRFLRHIAHGATTAQIEADVDLVDAQRMRRQHGLDRVGQVIIQPRRHFAHEFAETQHHAELIGLDPEESGEAPQHYSRHCDQGKAAAAKIARHQSAQPVLAAAQKFFEIGRFRAPRLWSRAPWAAALITPRHALLLGAGRRRLRGYRVAQLLLQRAVTPRFAASSSMSTRLASARSAWLYWSAGPAR